MVLSNASQFSLGRETYTHRNINVPSIVGNSAADEFVSKIESNFEYEVGYVPAGFEHRPDLISNVFYNTPNYWWLILLVNNIYDPFEGLTAGAKILIPKL